MINIVPFSFYYFLHMAQKEKKWNAPDREAGECTTYCRLRSNPTNNEYSILKYDPPARPQVHTKRSIGCILTGQARMVMRALTHIASFVETWTWTNHRQECHAHHARPQTSPVRARRPAADGVVGHSERTSSLRWRTLAEGAGNFDQVNLSQRWTLSVCVCKYVYRSVYYIYIQRLQW